MHGHRIATEIDTLLFFELVRQPIHDALIEVVTAQVRVTIGGLDFNDIVTDFQNRNIERATTEIVDGDCFIRLLIQTVGQGCRRRFVDNAFDIQPGNLAGIFGGLALTVIKVSRHSNDRFGHRLTEVVFRCLFEFLKHHGGDLRRRIMLIINLNAHVSRVAIGGFLHGVGHHAHFFRHFSKTAPHKSFNGVDRLIRVGHGLATCNLADKPLTIFGKGDDGRRCPTPFLVGDDGWLTAFHHCHNRVCRT